MSFNTKATTMEGFYQDLSNHMTDRARIRGFVPPSTGLTRPAYDKPIVSADDLFGQVDSWADQNTIRKGGAAFDMLDTPTAESYGARRYDFISREEGVRYRAYDDKTGRNITDPSQKKGLVTVGVGFNMERPESRKIFEEVLGKDADFDSVFSGRKSLTPTQVRKLFDYNIREAEDFVANRFKGVPLKEHQRLALVSIAFNNPSLIGPITTERVRKGDVNGTIQAILSGMNRSKVKGLASRRWREAEMFAGGGAALPAYAEYMKQFA